MPANRINYLVVYENDSQVYGSSTKKIALESPLPEHSTIEQKRVLFLNYEPDTGKMVVRKVPQEEVLSAEIKEKPKRKTKDG